MLWRPRVIKEDAQMTQDHSEGTNQTGTHNWTKSVGTDGWFSESYLLFELH